MNKHPFIFFVKHTKNEESATRLSVGHLEALNPPSATVPRMIKRNGTLIIA